MAYLGLENESTIKISPLKVESMIAIALLLLAIGLSMTITRTAAVMLELTGMSRDSARFQARAAYCGVGYASPESECIIEHPIRRRIISFLMMLGNAGTATVVATMILSFTKDAEGQNHLPMKLSIVAAGLAMLFVAARSQFVDRQMTKCVQYACKRFTQLDLNDYVALLNLAEGFSVLEVDVREGDWLGDQTLAALALPREGVLVLGVRKADGGYIGTPTGITRVDVGDTLTVYGKLSRLEELNQRRHGPSGLFARELAIDEQTRESAID